jgi:hypothetical protein
VKPSPVIVKDSSSFTKSFHSAILGAPKAAGELVSLKLTGKESPGATGAEGGSPASTGEGKARLPEDAALKMKLWVTDAPAERVEIAILWGINPGAEASTV